MNTRRLGVATLLAFAVTACAQDAAEEAGAEASEAPAQATEPAPTNAMGQPAFTPVDTASMQRTASGLFVQDLTEGTGDTAQSGSTVVVHYTGWFTDGREFDSSHGRNEPFTAQLGVGNVIAGWDEGMQGMKVGGKRRLVVPPELAYGAAGHPAGIPPNSTLVFEVELLEVR